MVCGRLESTPSMMALGSTLGTTVDGNHKGAGITKMQGQISRVQYYFENESPFRHLNATNPVNDTLNGRYESKNIVLHFKDDTN